MKKTKKTQAKTSAKKSVKKQAKVSRAVKKPAKKQGKASTKKSVKKQAKTSAKKSVKKQTKVSGAVEKPAKKHSGLGKKFQFIMKDVRCFAGEQVFEIRPLTFLIGENSTGKTTVLGCLSAIHKLIRENVLPHPPDNKALDLFYNSYFDRLFYDSHLDLNEMPYFMGLFEDVARKPPTQKQKTRFSLGFRTEMEGHQKDTEQIRYMFDFVASQKKNAPIMDHIGIYFKDFSFHCDKKFDKADIEFHSSKSQLFSDSIQDLGTPSLDAYRIEYKNKVFSVANSRVSIADLKADLQANTDYDSLPPDDLFDFLLDSVTCKFVLERLNPDNDYLRAFFSWYDKTDVAGKSPKNPLLLEESLQSKRRSYRADRHSFMEIFKNRPVPLAPVRSKPQRTYEPIWRDPDPEGSDIPVTLLRSSEKPKDWKRLYKKLINFGKASELFSDIEVRRLGTSTGDPFQLKFKIKEGSSNITNIGYGISQTLPILVRLFSGSSDTKDFSPERFFLQQPEMHLHPKAQAALSSLFIESVKTMNKSFLIETHSDYMVDRACIEIRKGNISPDDVSLIYLESRKDGSVRAHNISFDKEGNIKNVPKGYRDFFLKESGSLLGFED